MAYRLPTLLNARLSRRIVLWVFASIILIEIIILIPSVLRRERELLQQLTALSAARASGALEVNPPQSEADIVAALRAAQGEQVLGGALYRQDGSLVDSFGEPPQLTFEQIQQGTMTQLNRSTGRYDALWKMPPIGEDYSIIIRHSADVRQEFLAFVSRIAGLVVIISIFVTLATMVVLNRLLIHPIMGLRRDLRRVGQALSQDQANVVVPPLSSVDRQRKDELGEVMAAFEQMVRQIADAIAHRQQMETELRLSEEKFSKAFRASPDAVIISTLVEGRLLEVNQTFLEVVGLTQDAVLNRTVDQLGFWLNPSDRRTMIDLLQRQGAIRNQEYRFRTTDGRIRTALYSAEPIMLGGTACILSVINDITERKQAEEALKESENRFRTLVAQAVDAMFLVDRQGRFVDVNQQACRNLGYAREELLQRSVTDIQLALTPGDFDQIWQQISPEQPMTLEGLHQRQDGSSFPVEVR
ncbi:MAG: PAS domain S-box protein, partial [Cyanobacteria bacterium P01_A01_bin.135]